MKSGRAPLIGGRGFFGVCVLPSENDIDWQGHFVVSSTPADQAAADGRNPKPTALDVSTRRGSASDFFLDGFCLPFREPVSDVAVGQQILGLGRIVFQLLA